MFTIKFMLRHINAIRLGALLSPNIENFTGPLYTFSNNENPSPIIKLKNGPAIVPAIAISPNPVLANEQFNPVSGAEFPIERIVKPRNESGILNINPKKSIVSTIIFVIEYIQTILIIKVIKQIGRILSGMVSFKKIKNKTEATIETPHKLIVT